MSTITLDRAVVEQALEALEVATNCLDGYYIPRGKTTLPEIEDASTNLRAALAEPVQEPYCYVYEYDTPLGMHRTFYPKEHNGQQPDRAIPLYTAPPQRPAEPVQEPATLPGPGLVMCPACCSQFDPALNSVDPAQEPVAWRYQDARGNYRYRGYVQGFDKEYSLLKPVPLYTVPPQRKPLTEEEIAELARQEQFLLVCDGLDELTEITRAVERAHGIGVQP